MKMSRRQFFGGLTGKEGPGRQLSRTAAIDAYVRTHLLPYDFCLTDEQLDHLLGVVRSELSDGDGSEFSTAERQRMATIANEAIELWRDEYLRAEDKRRDAMIFVREFLLTDAGPFSKTVEEIEREALSWLYGLPHAQLAALDAADLKALVFSEMSIRYPTDKAR